MRPLKLSLVASLFSSAFIMGQLASAQSLTAAQIKQIEEIAQTIATQHNNSGAAMLDDMTASTRAVAIGRNVRYEYVLKVKKGLPPAKLKEFAEQTQGEIVPKACAINAKNPAFDRGLTYTYSYTNTYREKLAEFTVDKAVCRKYS
jgi:long-subunit fatty acid transport protein